jgi:hypothetical protein
LSGFVKLILKMERNKTFGDAIEALENGKRVQREGWNGKGLFVFMQVPSTINREIVLKCSLCHNW